MLLPVLMVLLWPTGFIGTKYGLPYADPLTFLAIRFDIVAVILVLWVLLRRSPWPSAGLYKHLLVVAALFHSLYLGCVYVAISWGLEAGTTTLIVSLQPLLVAALSGPVLGERVTPRQWIGLVLGLGGVALVVWRKAGLGGEETDVLAAAGVCVIGLFSISAALLYQKRFLSSMPLASGNALQFVFAALLTSAAALLLEEGRVEWVRPLILSLTWLVVVLSLGTTVIVLLLIRHGAAARVASLFFLMPPVAALMAWPLFGEVLTGLELVGLALVVLGVGLVNLPRRNRLPS